MPKRLLHPNYNYEGHFYILKSSKYTFEESFELFKSTVINSLGIKCYDQGIIKIEDILYENPYNITFKDKNNKKCIIGDYYSQHLNIKLNDTKILLSVRIIDRRGKLKGKDIFYIPFNVLQIVGIVPGEKTNIKSMVQPPSDKFEEIKYIKELIKNNPINTQDEELLNYLENKFDLVTVDGQEIKPPLIQFDENEVYLLDLNISYRRIIWLKLKETSKN